MSESQVNEQNINQLEKEKIRNDRLKLWIGFTKFLLGTFVLGLTVTLINREMQRRELELKEMERLGQYSKPT